MLDGSAQIVERAGEIREQPGLLRHLHHHGAIVGPDHLLQKLLEGVAVALDESGLAAADVGDQRDGEREVGFLPEAAKLARLAVVGDDEVLRFEISCRCAAAIGDGTGDGDQVDVYLNVGGLLGRSVDATRVTRMMCRLFRRKADGSPRFIWFARSIRRARGR